MLGAFSIRPWREGSDSVWHDHTGAVTLIHRLQQEISACVDMPDDASLSMLHSGCRSGRARQAAAPA